MGWGGDEFIWEPRLISAPPVLSFFFFSPALTAAADIFIPPVPGSFTPPQERIFTAAFPPPSSPPPPPFLSFIFYSAKNLNRNISQLMATVRDGRSRRARLIRGKWRALTGASDLIIAVFQQRFRLRRGLNKGRRRGGEGKKEQSGRSCYERRGRRLKEEVGLQRKEPDC